MLKLLFNCYFHLLSVPESVGWAAELYVSIMQPKTNAALHDLEIGTCFKLQVKGTISVGKEGDSPVVSYDRTFEEWERRCGVKVNASLVL